MPPDRNAAARARPARPRSRCSRWSRCRGPQLFGQGADVVGGRGRTILNVGGYYNFTPTFNLLFSAGRSVAGAMHTVAYLGLYCTWGGPHHDAPASTGAPPRWSLARRPTPRR